MSTSSKIQLRGICQCCGRQQAVMASGKMSKHGYTVEDGWFSGVCSGQNFAPMQVSIDQSKVMVKQVQTQVAALRAKATSYENCEIDPEMIIGGSSAIINGRFERLDIPFEDGTPLQQKDARASKVFALRRRAEMGDSWIQTMERLMVEYFGKALLEVPKETGPEPIPVGDTRVYRGKTVKAHTIDRGSVWVVLDGGTRFRVTTRAWRLLPEAK